MPFENVFLGRSTWYQGLNKQKKKLAGQCPALTLLFRVRKNCIFVEKRHCRFS